VFADLARDVLGLAEDAEPHEVERRLLRTLPLLYPGEEDSREARTALVTVGMLLGVLQGGRPVAGVIRFRDEEEAVRIASEFPWGRIGCVEVRPVRDIDAVRRRVGASAHSGAPAVLEP